MKEDYLWDKTGEDSEIESLESTLSAFRYKRDDPPALPVAVSEASRPRLWWLRFVLVPAAAACVIGTVVFVFWQPGTSTDVAQTAVDIEAKQPIVIAPTESRPEGPVRGDRTPVVARHEQTPAQVPSGISSGKVRHAVRTSRKSQEPTLTRKEKYAYDRLMLALSITGSKLRLVQDKVNGIELEKNGSKNDK